MKMTKQPFEKIKHVFPKSRGSVQIDHFTMINILLYVVENGCKWRALPKEFGNWHTVYMRMRRWAENGVLFHLFEALQNELKLHVDTSALSLDSSCIKVYPDGTGALKKRKTIHRQNTRRKVACFGEWSLFNIRW
ncbi:MAG: transposase [Thermoguttaceae bacterium]|nr:transposase [Thermoguttaceae bacterium]